MARRSALRNAAEGALSHLVLASLRHWRLGAFYANLLDRTVPRLRRIANRNLVLAYPDRTAEWRRQTIDEVFASIARVLDSFPRFAEIDRNNIRDWIRYEGFEHYERAKARGKGVLFATAHLGNWELSAFAHALLTEPMNVVVRPLDNPVLDEYVERNRALSGNRLLSKRDFARSILHALRANEPVGILVDQNVSADHGVFADFFGIPACANTTFARLAARSGAAVIPGFATWNSGEGRYVLTFYPEVEITGDAAADTARIQSAVEYAIRKDPGQWLWIHRRWKTRPAGEPPLYANL